MRDPDFGSRAWAFPALLSDYSSGMVQATRRGANDEIRAGLSRLLGPVRAHRGTAAAGQEINSRQANQSPSLPPHEVRDVR
jgi:hypothetical protein